MVIKTNIKLKDLADKEIDLTVGQAIANVLVSDDAGGKMKSFVLAKRFYSSESMDVDEADLSLVKSAIERNKSYTPLITGQLLVLLEA